MEARRRVFETLFQLIREFFFVDENFTMQYFPLKIITMILTSN